MERNETRKGRKRESEREKEGKKMGGRGGVLEREREGDTGQAAGREGALHEARRKGRRRPGRGPTLLDDAALAVAPQPHPVRAM